MPPVEGFLFKTGAMEGRTWPGRSEHRLETWADRKLRSRLWHFNANQWNSVKTI